MFVTWLAVTGNLGAYLTMEQLLGLSDAVPGALALLGSVARGLR
ncbi:hypothetical protein [Natrialba aegyptia]|nr:hypothetical protein [Natrialba aegyptia]